MILGCQRGLELGTCAGALLEMDILPDGSWPQNGVQICHSDIGGARYQEVFEVVTTQVSPNVHPQETVFG